MFSMPVYLFRAIDIQHEQEILDRMQMDREDAEQAALEVVGSPEALVDEVEEAKLCGHRLHHWHSPAPHSYWGNKTADKKRRKQRERERGQFILALQ